MDFESLRLPGYRGVVALAADASVLYVSDGLVDRFGWPPGHWTGVNGMDLLDERDLEQAAASFEGTTERGGFHQPLTLRVVCADGSRREVVVVARNLLDDPAVGAVVLNVNDSADYMHYEALAVSHTAVLESIAHDGSVDDTMNAVARFVEAQIPAGRCAVMLVREQQLVVSAAPSIPPPIAAQMCGATAADDGRLSAETYTKSEGLVAPDLPDPQLPSTSRIAFALDARACWSVPVCSSHNSRALGVIEVYYADPVHPRPEEWSILKAAARLAALALTHHRRRAELEQRAIVDSMTGLANRRWVEETVERVLDARGGGAVLFLDIDRLKSVNDSLGHAVGDELIAAVADRLREFVRPNVHVGRFGGDEFVIVVEGAPDRPAEHLAEQILQRLRVPLRVGHRRLPVRSSIGVAHINDQRCGAAVLSDADMAMYEAKAAGRDRYHVCTDALRHRAAHHLDLESRLRSAIERGLIDVHYQPILDCRTGVIRAVEALARWKVDDAFVSPAEFIAVAEESGLVIPLGERVLLEACRAGLMLAPEVPGFRVTVNVSAVQMQAGQLASTVTTALDATGLDPAKLCLEVTESVLMSGDPALVSEIDALRDRGVTFAIDDFGTGYSSLAYLQRLPVDVLKIDRVFVGATDRITGRAVLTAIAQLAKQLGMTTVAEGIETPEQLAVVTEIGIDALQGYLLGRPMPLADLQARLPEFIRGFVTVS